MKKFIAFVLPLFIVGCAGTAMVEVGVNDEATLLAGTAGDVGMRVLRIEVPEGDSYNTIWEGVKYVQIPTTSSDFISITENYIEITPDAYQHIRLTVDSVRYVNETTTVLIETSYQFNANAFTEIVIEENDEFRLVVGIASTTWLDTDSIKIREGFDAFQGATLKISYEF